MAVRTCNNQDCAVVVYKSPSHKVNNEAGNDDRNRCPACTWLGTPVGTPNYTKGGVLVPNPLRDTDTQGMTPMFITKSDPNDLDVDLSNSWCQAVYGGQVKCELPANHTEKHRAVHPTFPDSIVQWG